jgi:hypothetical protein
MRVRKHPKPKIKEPLDLSMFRREMDRFLFLRRVE